MRKETFGGALLLIAAAAALIWANSPWSAAYEAVRDAQVGPGVLHLHLSLGTWAADGLLAIFFFVAGLELKREFVAGDLRDPRLAALPVAAALSGVAVPAGLYFAINLGNGGDTSGWAIPTATDIALAVLAVVGSRLPSALPTFLLTLAVVGFTVSLLIGELAFGAETQRDDHVKVAILAGSLLAAMLASMLLRSRHHLYDRLAQQERLDSDRDGAWLQPAGQLLE